MDWAQIDEDGAMRQRYLDLDDRLDDLRDQIELSEWSWAEFQEMHDISWLYHENGLEGVVLAYPEIKSAVDHKIVSDVSLLPAYNHIKNQKWCIDQVREKADNKRANITVAFLKELHAKLVADPEMVGVYRKDIPIHRTYFHTIAQPNKIHQELEVMLEYLRARNDREMHPIEFAAIVHHKFMAVFPFAKFSGMIGRLLINFVLGRAGYLPAVLHATDRQRYYEALRGPERNFRLFLTESLENGVDNALKLFSSGERARA